MDVNDFMLREDEPSFFDDEAIENFNLQQARLREPALPLERPRTSMDDFGQN